MIEVGDVVEWYTTVPTRRHAKRRGWARHTIGLVSQIDGDMAVVRALPSATRGFIVQQYVSRLKLVSKGAQS